MSARGRTILYTAAACLALIGLAEAVYLTVMNLTGETAICGDSMDCFKVLGSSYARIGPLPVAGLGALAYYASFSCAVFAAFGYIRARTFFVLVVVGMFLATLWFLYVQAFLLHAFCRYCLFSASLIFILTAVVVLTPRSD
jgi:uncharacterized membrane protein